MRGRQAADHGRAGQPTAHSTAGIPDSPIVTANPPVAIPNSPVAILNSPVVIPNSPVVIPNSHPVIPAKAGTQSPARQSRSGFRLPPE